VIVLWLSGGPSQFETFDPKPGTKWGTVGAIKTGASGIEIADLYPRLADEMASVSLVRSLVTPEGEHERGTYLLRTGYRPQPTVVHPSLGAVVAKELAPPELDIPAHIAINVQNFGPPKGGLLGADWDAASLGDPKGGLPDLKLERLDERLQDRAVIDEEFARGRGDGVQRTNHAQLAEKVRSTVRSPRLKAFDYKEEPASVVASYGDSAFGRGCLVARRLVEQGVKTVEVELGGWDSHTGNLEAHRKNAAVLDPAFASLLKDLRERNLLEKTIVLCAGEFGRTPAINRLEGRDHFSRGFSCALAGGGIRGGVVVGETDASGEKPPVEPVSPGDLFATIYTALGIDPGKENVSRLGRPIALAEGKPVRKLLA
jgi:uncharacterized protein (DUF1501 family)